MKNPGTHLAEGRQDWHRRARGAFRQATLAVSISMLFMIAGGTLNTPCTMIYCCLLKQSVTAGRVVVQFNDVVAPFLTPSVQPPYQEG